MRIKNVVNSLSDIKLILFPHSLPLVVRPVEVVEVLLVKDLLGLGSEEPLGVRGGAAGDLLDKLQLGVLHVDGGGRK